MKEFEFYRPKSWFVDLPKNIRDRIYFFTKIDNGIGEAVVIDFIYASDEIVVHNENNLPAQSYKYIEMDLDELIMYRSQQPRKIIEAIFFAR